MLSAKFFDDKLREAKVPAHGRGQRVKEGGLRLGEVTEWSKVHDWKSCVPKGTGGSNPFLSALWSCQRRPVNSARPGREQR